MAFASHKAINVCKENCQTELPNQYQKELSYSLCAVLFKGIVKNRRVSPKSLFTDLWSSTLKPTL